MGTIIVTQAVITVPLVTRVATYSLISALQHWYAHHPLSWHRRRRAILRALAVGVMLH